MFPDFSMKTTRSTNYRCFRPLRSLLTNSSRWTNLCRAKFLSLCRGICNLHWHKSHWHPTCCCCCSTYFCLFSEELDTVGDVYSHDDTRKTLYRTSHKLSDPLKKLSHVVLLFSDQGDGLEQYLPDRNGVRNLKGCQRLNHSATLSSWCVGDSGGCATHRRGSMFMH